MSIANYLVKAPGIKKVRQRHYPWWEGCLPKLTEFWSDYPDMNTIDNRRDLIKQCGYKLLGDFVLPESAWWNDYYDPMYARLEVLKKKYAGDEVAAEVINDCFAEIALYKSYPDYYGYVFLIMSIES